MDKLVSPFQAAFIPGRWIGENSILANEIIHTMKKSRRGKGLVGIKLNMLKAYDHVDWGMLTRIISKFGFSHKLVDLILRCISSDSVELLLNGSVFGRVDVERGIHQGGPLSPFLFILYSKLLSRMLLNLERDEKLHGIKIGRTSPSISYLFFADDILIFCKANTEEITQLKECLHQYCTWTGQRINASKSGCFFL